MKFTIVFLATVLGFAIAIPVPSANADIEMRAPLPAKVPGSLIIPLPIGSKPVSGPKPATPAIGSGPFVLKPGPIVLPLPVVPKPEEPKKTKPKPVFKLPKIKLPKWF